MEGCKKIWLSGFVLAFILLFVGCTGGNKTATTKKEGKTPGGLAALAYDAARVLFTAIERAGTLDRAAIKEEIAKTQNFPGVTGNITINEFGDSTKSAVVLQIKGDQYKFVTRIEPEEEMGAGVIDEKARKRERYKPKQRASAPPPAQDEIVIGIYCDLTGENSTFGEETRNGVTLAAEEVNAKGGVLGKKVRLLIEDTRSDPIQARNVVTKLIQKDAVVAVIGEVASKMSLAGGPVCDQFGVPMISPSSTNPKVTEVGEYIFRVCFIDPFQGAVMAKFAAENLKVKRVAILYDNSSDYSVGLAQFFAHDFKKRGGTIVGELTYKPTDTDFRSQLTTIKAQQPEAIFIPGYYNKVGLIARQARELGIQVPLLGGDGWSSPELVAGAGGPGKALEGCYFSDHYSPEDPAPQIQEFIRKYKARF